MSSHLHYRPSCAPLVVAAIVFALLLLAGS